MKSSEQNGVNSTGVNVQNDFPFFIIIAVAVGLGALFLFGWDAGDTASLEPGVRMPPLMATSWINGHPPSDSEMLGQVVVIDCFATWCGPCNADMPHVVETYDSYRDQGVVFVNLTPEDGRSYENLMAFKQTHGVSWPMGYGAGPTLEALGVNALPTKFVVGREGRIVWNSIKQSNVTLEQAIEHALKEEQ